MNVYDFDKTLYPEDSTLCFYRYCAARYPRSLLALPGSVPAAAGYLLGRRSRQELKESLFRFLRAVPSPEEAAEEFWDREIGKIRSWYGPRRRPDDLVISASPAFLIEAACRRLDIACLASPVDPVTGRFQGPNCRGEEKLRRFRRQFGGAAVEEFYSDSLSDVPMAAVAERAFLVDKNGWPHPWPKKMH